MDAPLYGAQSKSSIERKRRLAEALLQSATDASPVGHWTQALARGVQGLASGYIASKADKEDSGRRSALVEALMGAKPPSDLEALGLQYDEPMAFDIASGRRRDAELGYQHGQDAQAQNNWQQSFDAEQAYRNRPAEPKRYSVGGNLVDEGGNVVYQGVPKPHKLTESEIKGKSIQQAAGPAVAYLTQGATSDNPFPVIDELASWSNTLGRGAEEWGGAAVMSEKGQAAFDALTALTQQSIYAESGQQAPEQEVKRLAKLLMPSALDKPERIAQKKAQIQGMIDMIKSRAQSAVQEGTQQMDMGGDGTTFGEVGQIPEGAVVEDEQGARYRKENGTLVPVQ